MFNLSRASSLVRWSKRLIRSTYTYAEEITNISNYRPISLICNIAKTCEKCIYNNSSYIIIIYNNNIVYKDIDLGSF